MDSAKIQKDFVVFLVAVMLTTAGYKAVFPLASSLNASEAVGTISIAVGYLLSIIAILLFPILESAFSLKKIIIVALAFYILFILGNCSATIFTLLPAGLLFGTAEGLFWTAGPFISVNFALSKTKGRLSDFVKQRSRFTGYFFASANVGSILGSGISFLFLFVDKTLSGKGNFTRNQDFSFCGANDCQDPNITLANIDQYTPAYPATRYSLIGFLALLEVIAICLLLVYLPKNINQNIDPLEGIENPTNTASLQPSKLICRTTIDRQQVNRQKFPQVLKASLLHTFKLLIKKKHILVMLLPMYEGMLNGFFFADMTRAFVSCVLGVDKVGIVVIVYAAANSISSYLAGQLAGKYGRNFPFLYAFLLHIATFALCLYLKITPDTSWTVYITALLIGANEGVWLTLTNEMYGSYFQKQGKYAYVAWTLMALCGMTIQLSLNRILCVRQKIYLLIAVLPVALISYGASYYIYVRRKLKSTSTDEHKMTAIDMDGNQVSQVLL
ncbi:protein unc-93 homolog A-like isoform X1 [Clavelina lepadiformis]|uniref:protein unc-93 homolog A-like isoform X1 n=2 Tax=Clavelina lepadiformis TaxID=159417 RepID=UPI0040416196